MTADAGTEAPRVRDAGTIERLLYLRLLLRDAQQRAQDRTHLGRHSAAIQLDGACEHAMMLALGELEQAEGKNFHGHFERLKNNLGNRWTADGWSGVSRLHGTRTEAQHRGTVPDASEFARWSADAERFINSLVAATFGVELATVAVSDAVETESVRELLARAEHEFSAEQFADSFRSSLDALAEARRRWEGERTDALGRRDFKPPFNEDLAPKDLRQAVDEMHDLVIVGAFAPDPGEYVWMRSVAGMLNLVPAGRDDAERALAFVTGWVLRWEAFSHRYTKDRMGAWRSTHRPPTTSDAEAMPTVKLIDVQQPRALPSGDTGLGLRFQVSDIPEEDCYSWLQELNKQLMARWTGRRDAQFPHADEVGEVTVSGVDDAEEARRVATEVRAAVESTHRAWRAMLTRLQETPDYSAEERQRLEAALVGITFDGAPFVQGVTTSTVLRGRGADKELITSLMVELSTANDSKLRHDLSQILYKGGHAGPGPGNPVDLRGDALVVRAGVTPELVRETLSKAVNQLETALSAAREKSVRDKQLSRRLADAAQEALRVPSTAVSD